jgi:uncharacterized membrane protein
MAKKYPAFLITLSIIGILDAGFLTAEYFSHKIPPCYANSLFTDCGKVLNSPFATIAGIPVALFGLLFYSVIFYCALTLFFKESKVRHILPILSMVGIIASAYFVFLQIVVIKAICLYCMTSAINTIVIFFTIRYMLKKEPAEHILRNINVKKS